MVNEPAAPLQTAGDAPFGNDEPAQDGRAALDEIEAALDDVAATLAHMG